jgi:hypothetical protein
MADYRLTDRKFSRLWRRSKDYSDHEIRWLARRRGLTMSVHKQTLQVIHPKTKKVIANFKEIPKTEAFIGDEKTRLFAALRLGV